MRDERGAVIGVLTTATTTTARLRAERALRNRDEHFRAVADVAPQIVWITDPHGRVEYFNTQWTRFTGAPYEPITAAPVAASFVHPDDGAATVVAFDEARRTGGVSWSTPYPLGGWHIPVVPRARRGARQHPVVVRPTEPTQPDAHAAPREVQQVVEHARHPLAAPNGTRRERRVVRIGPVGVRRGTAV